MTYHMLINLFKYLFIDFSLPWVFLSVHGLSLAVASRLLMVVTSLVTEQGL